MREIEKNNKTKIKGLNNAPHIVLVGNPNVGKSVIFHALTGVYAEVSNFPGTTVDVLSGSYRGCPVTDTPGIYGVSYFNDEERVARDVILDGDIIVNVVDAVHLSRDLFLTQQLIDMDKRMVVCLNMMDEAKRQRLDVSSKQLSRELGVPVIETSAICGQGIDELKNCIFEACRGIKVPEIKNRVSQFADITEDRAERLLLAEDDLQILKKYSLSGHKFRDELYGARRKRVDEITDIVITSDVDGNTLSAWLGRRLYNPCFGIPVFLLCISLFFWFVGVVAAQYAVDFTEEIVMNEYYCPFIRWLICGIIPKETFFGQILIGEFGLLTMVPTYIFGLLLPVVAAFYLSLSYLEDSGYLSRLAVLTDKLFSKIGLNGRAIIPIILGFGCVTAATVSTRLLGTKREKIIVTALLGITVPCSAQLGLIISRLVPLGLSYVLVYCLIMLIIFGIIGAILDKFLGGEPTALLIDIPPLRLPKMKNVIKKTFNKTLGFIEEAFWIFSLGALIISCCEFTGVLDGISKAAEPIITGILGLPRECSAVFVMGLMRRDFGVAGLSEIPLNPCQTLVIMVVLTLFVPCIASVLTMFKERSKLETVLIWIFSIIIAVTVGGLLNLLTLYIWGGAL